MKIKSSKVNFSYTMLPRNRRAQFFDILKTRFSTIFLMMICSLISFIPFLIAFMFKVYFIDENVAALEEELIYSGVALVTLIFDGIFFICFAFIFVIYAGLSNITKKLVYGDGVLFWNDFKIGIKENWKIFLISSLLFSFFKLINDLAIYYLPIDLFNYVPTVISLLILLPILLFAMSLGVTYNFNNYFNLIKNASILCFKKFFITLCFVLISAGICCVYFLYFIPFIAMIIYLLIGTFLPFITLAFYLFSTSVFDSEINSSENKEYYHKGLMDQYSNTRKLSLKERLISLEKELRNKS